MVPLSRSPAKMSMLVTASIVSAVVRTSADTEELITSFSVRTSTVLPTVSWKSVPTTPLIVPTAADTDPVTVMFALVSALKATVLVFTVSASPTDTAASSLADAVRSTVDASRRDSTCISKLSASVLNELPLLTLIASPTVTFNTVPTSTFAVVPTRAFAVASRSTLRSPPVTSTLLRPENATLPLANMVASVVDSVAAPMISAATCPASNTALSPASTSRRVLALTVMVSVSNDASVTADTATLRPASITMSVVVASNRSPAIARTVEFALTVSVVVESVAASFAFTSSAFVVNATVFPPSILMESATATSIVWLVTRALPCANTSTPPEFLTLRSCADMSNVLFTFATTSSDVTVSWSPTDSTASLNALSVKSVVVPLSRNPANKSTLFVTSLVMDVILLAMCPFTRKSRLSADIAAAPTNRDVIDPPVILSSAPTLSCVPCCDDITNSPATHSALLIV